MKWITKTGEQIELKNLDNNHLLNCINLMRNSIPIKLGLTKILEKQALAMISYLASCPPDGAAMAVETELGNLYSQENQDQILSECSKIFCALMIEAQKRKLKTKS